ncbi:hypothetical protein COO60DRAFT_1561459 [Scenedesmus sp. NREL 46B-D3]|nr:hypothetical protein COO60DRAFT_1561459 [Scenedesmus sp. NREL 46B-D3]
MAVAEAGASTIVVPLSSTSETHLEYLVRNTQSCVLRPYCFFVSWQGVLTLAYRGFPPALVSLKQQIGDFYQSLPKESPGSRWPKTSLAAVREGRRLTPAQLQRLNDICREQSGIFQAPGQVKAQAVLVDALSTVVYETRCLERVVSRRVVQLQQPADLSGASADEAARVQGVVAEADDDNYWFHASRDGNRDNHYRNPALGVTLVHELACFQQQQPSSTTQPPASAASGPRASSNSADGNTPKSTTLLSSNLPDSSTAAAPSTSSSSSSSLAQLQGSSGVWSAALPGIVSKFRAAVDAELPGLYAWFEEQSLHVTVRAIIV